MSHLGHAALSGSSELTNSTAFHKRGYLAMANATQSRAHVRWVSEPRVRGTASLLSSCISTIALCTWTALHLDVPDKGVKRTYLRKLRYLALALLAPELITMTAFVDWYVTRALTKEMHTFKVGTTLCP